jgi:hypothetical protein
MRKVLLAIVCFAPFCACNDEIALSGRTVQVEKVESSFSGIGVRDRFELLIAGGSESKFRIEADEEIIRHVKSEIKDGILYFYKDPDATFPVDAAVRILVTKDSLRVLKASGANIVIGGDSSRIDTLRTDTLDINLSGASSLKGAVECRSIRARFNNATVDLTGAADRVEMQAGEGTSAGTSGEKGSLKAINVTAILSGGSSASLTVSGELEVRASENSVFYYAGKPVIRNIILDDNSKVVAHEPS